MEYRYGSQKKYYSTLIHTDIQRSAFILHFYFYFMHIVFYLLTMWIQYPQSPVKEVRPNGNDVIDCWELPCMLGKEPGSSRRAAHVANLSLHLQNYFLNMRLLSLYWVSLASHNMKAFTLSILLCVSCFVYTGFLLL